MKDVEYKPHWSSDSPTMTSLFGEELHTTDTADAYEVAESKLFFDGKKYTWMQASGCSCWDGDYYGWQLGKTELKKLAKARSKDEDGYRGAGHEKLMAIWIVENIK